MIVPSFAIGNALSGRLDAQVTFDLTVPARDLGSDDPVFLSDLSFHAIFARIDRELRVTVAGLRTATEACCTRCGRSFTQTIAIETMTCFVPLDGFDEDCPVHIDRKRGEANLSEWLRVEILAVSNPLPLCKQSCKGRCPFCGADLNETVCTCTRKRQPNSFTELKNIFKYYSM